MVTMRASHLNHWIDGSLWPRKTTILEKPQREGSPWLPEPTSYGARVPLSASHYTFANRMVAVRASCFNHSASGIDGSVWPRKTAVLEKPRWEGRSWPQEPTSGGVGVPVCAITLRVALCLHVPLSSSPGITRSAPQSGTKPHFSGS